VAQPAWWVLVEVHPVLELMAAVQRRPVVVLDSLRAGQARDPWVAAPRVGQAQSPWVVALPVPELEPSRRK